MSQVMNQLADIVEVREFALKYAGFQWRVVREKIPGTKRFQGGRQLLEKDGSPKLWKGKEPDIGEGWQRKATTDPNTIMAWFSDKHSGCNVGVQLGPASGIVDFECDSDEARETFLKLFEGVELNTATFKSSRGQHYIFKWTDELNFAGAVLYVGGLELRLGTDNIGAQSVFPPSVHITGSRYAWLEGAGPDEVELQEIPSIVIERIRSWHKPPKAEEKSASPASSTSASCASPRLRDLQIDYVAEIRYFFGDRMVGEVPSHADWWPCRAIDHDGGDVPAGFNIRNGYYKDHHQPNGKGLTFVEALVEFKKFPSVRDAARHLRARYQPGFVASERKPRSTPKHVGASPEHYADTAAVLSRLRLSAVGTIAGTNTAVLHSAVRMRSFKVPQVEKLKLEVLVQHAGGWIQDHVVPRRGAETDPSILDMDQVRMAVSDACGEHLIDPSSFLGPGVWGIGEEIALVRSDLAITVGSSGCELHQGPKVRGRIVDFALSDAGAWFDAKWIEPELHDNEDRSLQAFAAAREVFSQWDNWAAPGIPDLLTSLVCCTWVQSTWKIRPFISVCGRTNTGKTTLFKALRDMFGTLAISIDDPSAAAIRQALNNSARPLILDELEHSQEREKVLKMLRTATRGGTIGRGTAEGVYRGLSLHVMPWVAATENGLSAEADANRFIQLDLLEPCHKRSLIIPDTSRLGEIGRGLLVAAVRHLHRAHSIFRQIRDENVPGVDRRLIEIYAVPVSMMAAINGIDEAEARLRLHEYLKGLGAELAVEREECSLLADILGSRLPGREFRTVADAIRLTEQHNGEGDEARRLLASVGVGVCDRGLFFYKRDVQRHLLGDTEWSGKQLRQLLSRIPGAEWIKRRVGTHGSPVWGALVPAPEGVFHQNVAAGCSKS